MLQARVRSIFTLKFLSLNVGGELVFSVLGCQSSHMVYVDGLYPSCSSGIAAGLHIEDVYKDID